MTTINTEDIWRLYCREWVVVHTVHMQSLDAQNCVMAARKWADEHLQGRVVDNDIRLDVFTDGGSTFWCHVKVFKDNLKGEFKYAAHATRFAAAEGYEEYTIVPRNSKADHDIRNYGVTKL